MDLQHVPEALGGAGGIQSFQSEATSLETTELEGVCETMKMAERDFWRALPEDFLRQLGKLDPAFQTHWLQLNMSRAQKYLNEWEDASRIFLNLTQFYDRDLKRCDNQLDSMTAVLMMATKKLADLTQTIKQPSPAPPPPEHEPSASASMVKLDLATFSGYNALEFLPWFQAFKAAVLDTQLPPVQKMIYLNHYCTDQARDTIEQFQITGENLQLALKVLKERFHRPDLILNGTFNKLVALPRLDNLSDVYQLRKFYDTVQTSLSIIKSQDNSYEQQPHLLLCTLKAKMSDNILRDFERHCHQIKLHDPSKIEKTKTLPFFMDFFRHYVTTEETINDRHLLPSKKEFA